ncbi:metal-dependent hydrolase [Hymenobacter weizhouensis]|uniref:metal-dependent hydrolase n=1 Tax=Hymenobacter sp. YIM 151500-1 TaxID=2987689 RepID=UPI002225E550|nr:metal-dependent hydrolase [Hymenobacter sp. YIM 151500-1]UYZ63383.1 metal-dependent hydrolase [Hymenobacter sp. YIM 151500-1]
MQLTYYGHSCFLLRAGGSAVLFDPFIRPNPLAQEVDVEAIPADFILLSHGHGDHVADVEEIGRRTGAQLVGVAEVVGWFEQKGLNATYGINLGGTVRLPFGSVKMVAAAHSSSLPDGSYGGVAAGFIIEAEGKTLYFAGDTALTYDMKIIGERHKLDVALLPIGGHFTMDVDDALVAADWTGASRIIGMHFDSFPPISINHAEATAKAQQAGKELVLLKIGESVTL